MHILLFIILLAILNFVVVKLLFRWQFGFREENFEDIIAWWVKRGYNRGVLFIKPFGHKYYSLRLVKRIDESGEYAMFLIFPTNICQVQYLSRLCDYCVRKGLKTEVKENGDRKTLEIDFGKKADPAAETARHIFFELFRLRQNKRFCFCYFHTCREDMEITDASITPDRMNFRGTWKSWGFFKNTDMRKLKNPPIPQDGCR